LRPDYTKEIAVELLTNRYKQGIIPIRFTLERLASDPNFMALVQQLHKEGWKDWHFLTAISNIVINERINSSFGSKLYDPKIIHTNFMEVLKKEESKGDPIIPHSLFTENRLRDAISMSQGSTLRILGLEIKQRMPNMKAIDHFLRVRYNYWDDDVEHDAIL